MSCIGASSSSDSESLSLSQIPIVVAERKPLRTWRLTPDGLVEITENNRQQMGAFLDKPKTAKTNSSGEGNVTEVLKSNGGVLCSKSIALLEEGIKAGFLSLDENIRKRLDTDRSGSTAVCAMVTPTHIIIANLGDSRAVVSRKGERSFGTEDHKVFIPYHDKERERIVGAGGSVMIQRINGSLAVSRAFGDFEYKSVPGLDPCKQLVSPEPDVYVLERQKDKDEFLVVACDGIYDVMENEELCRFVESRLHVCSDLNTVCNDALDACLSKGSRDNMTMIVVCFEGAPCIDHEKVAFEEAWKEEMRKAIEDVISLETGKSTWRPNDEIGIEFVLRQLAQNDSTPRDGPAHMVRSLVDQVSNIASNYIFPVLSLICKYYRWNIFCLGRFFMGCGAGLGFVCATVVLFEMVPYTKRPAHFFVLGLAFAFATLIINVLPLLDANSTQIILFSSLFTGLSGADHCLGVLYLLLKPNENEILKNDHLDFPHEKEPAPSSFPVTLVYALMMLNVTIGVPIILGFSTVIFQNFGVTFFYASIFSTTFPVAQIVLILILHKTLIDRRILIIGGYAVAVFIQTILLLTLIYPYIPSEHAAVAESILLWLLAVVVSVPCNTALCVIGEQFTSPYEQMVFTSRGRAVMWILAAVSTTSFVPMLKTYGLAITFMPYITLSLMLLLLIVKIYPTYP
uniref:PPM-type phosphatase domain-containing protein n=1 Tax=Heterorhabditis bacteriophora TaxID=37862 RepID=A0A1I7XPQ0_HETBA